MKKSVSLFLIIAAVIFLASCARTEKDFPEETDKNPKNITVCIDPGHGFGDIGCENEQINGYEKDLTLTLSKVLKKALEKEGVTVILTHDGQSFPSVSEICVEADKEGVLYDIEKMDENEVFGKYERAVWENVLDAKYSLDMFISIHINSIDGHPEVQGASVDYCTENPHAKMLEAFCETLSDNLTSDNISDSCRIFADSPEDAYVVTKYSTAPSVLIEAGYATNREDARNMLDKKWQESFATAVCNAVLSHAGK